MRSAVMPVISHHPVILNQSFFTWLGLNANELWSNPYILLYSRHSQPPPYQSYFSDQNILRVGPNTTSHQILIIQCKMGKCKLQKCRCQLQIKVFARNPSSKGNFHKSFHQHRWVWLGRKKIKLHKYDPKFKTNVIHKIGNTIKFTWVTSTLIVFQLEL